MGRWVSQDPLGFDAGDSNLFRYTRNQFTGIDDPSGYKPQEIVRGVWSRGRYEYAEKDSFLTANIRVALSFEVTNDKKNLRLILTYDVFPAVNEKGVILANVSMEKNVGEPRHYKVGERKSDIHKAEKDLVLGVGLQEMGEIKDRKVEGGDTPVKMGEYYRWQIELGTISVPTNEITLKGEAFVYPATYLENLAKGGIEPDYEIPNKKRDKILIAPEKAAVQNITWEMTLAPGKAAMGKISLAETGWGRDRNGDGPTRTIEIPKNWNPMYITPQQMLREGPNKFRLKKEKE
jgi:hypothetical protein